MTFAHHTWFVEQGHRMTQMARDEIAQIWQEGAPVTLPKGDALGIDVVPPATVCILMEGFAKLVTMNADGKRFALTVLQPGDFFGGLSTTSTASDTTPMPALSQLELLEPVTDVTLVQMPQPRLKALLDANPALSASVMQYLEGRTRLVQRKLTDMLFKDVHARVAQLLLDFCFDHGDECP
jgi:CRP-like cAMP-binding protein